MTETLPLHLRKITMPLALIFLIPGCESRDKRLADFAERANEQQVQQNDRMAAQGQEIAEASGRLIEADAQARGEVIAAQQQLQEQQAEVGTQRDALETERRGAAQERREMDTERRQLAAQRQRDPVIAAAITSTGVILACALPLVICWYLLRTLRPEKHEDQDLAELLVLELAADEPVLLPPPAGGYPSTGGRLLLPPSGKTDKAALDGHDQP